ncbi:hypothetical protein HI972_000625 [Salmonella enterica]|nr:hypothetical protein [Salmonella enterica]
MATITHTENRDQTNLKNKKTQPITRQIISFLHWLYKLRQPITYKNIIYSINCYLITPTVFSTSAASQSLAPPIIIDGPAVSVP